MHKTPHPAPSWLLQGRESRLSVELVFRLHQAVDPASDVDIDEVECMLANLIYRVRACLCGCCRCSIVGVGSRLLLVSVRGLVFPI